MTGVPIVQVQDVLDHLLRGNMAEVEPRREACRGLQVRMISVFVVTLEAVVEEFSPPFLCRDAASFHPMNRSHVVVDVEGFQGLAADSITFSGAPDEFQGGPRRVGLSEGQVNEVADRWIRTSGRSTRSFSMLGGHFVFDFLFLSQPAF